MANEDVVTGIDGLLKYLAEKGETDIGTLSSAMGVSETTVHDWAAVLEKAQLVVITYKLGKMYVSLLAESIKVSDTPADTSQMPAANAPSTTTNVHYEKLTVEEIEKLNTVKSSILNDNIESQMRVVERLEPQIHELHNYIDDAQKLFKNKSVEFKSYMNQLNALHADAAKSFESVGAYKKELEALTTEMEKGTGAAGQQSIVNNLDETAKNTNALIDDIRGKSALISTSTDELLAAFDQKVEEERRKLVEFSSHVKAESKRLDSFTQSAEGQLTQYQRQAESYRRAFEKYMARAAKEREAFIDRSTKAQNNLDSLYNVAAKKFNEFDLMLSNEIVEMGKVTELEQKLNNIKSEIVEITTERDNLKKELQEFSVNLDEIQKGKKKNPAESNRLIADIEKKSKTYGAQMKEIKDKISVVDGEVEDVSNLTKANKKQ